MNILLDTLPKMITIDETKMKIQSDYRIGIRFELLMSDVNKSPSEKLIEALMLYYPVIPANLQLAMDKIMWFYNCGNMTTKNKKGKNVSTGPLFSYVQDQHYIYTAFMTYYHINLNTIKYLHWWEFQSLFQNLPDDAKLKKIMMYRSIHLDANMSSEQRKFYADMKSIYKLDSQENDTQKANSFASILAGGMHIPDEIKQ